MKKVILLSMVAALAFSSCEKDLYNPELTKKTVKDLVVPADFDWEMTQTVTVNLKAATVETPVKVYTDARCTDEFLVADITAYPNLEIPLVLKIPVAQKNLYIVYSDGTKEVIAIKDQKADLVLAPITKAGTRGWGNGSNEDEILMMSSPWSTIMFEDLFPRLGDYDFNDFVANYKYSVVYTVSAKDQTNLNASHVQGYQIDLRVNAVGATLPITPYLRVSSTDFASDFTNNSQIEIETSNPNIKVTKVQGGNGYHVYKFENMANDPANGITYINTEANKELAAPLTVKILAHTVKSQGTKVTEHSVGSITFDFFITNGTTEIHKRGFNPVLSSNYPASEIEDGAGTLKYSNSNNMIWALDVPVLIDHAIERTNFMHAYPNFELWATSGGTQNTEWYKNPVADKLIPYMTAFPVQ